MKPSLLIPFLAFLATIPCPSEPNDFVPWFKNSFKFMSMCGSSLYFSLKQFAPHRSRFAVEKDSSPEPCGRLDTKERPLMCLGNKCSTGDCDTGNRLGDKSVCSIKLQISEVRYSKNHDLFRSVGFLTVMAAVGTTGLMKSHVTLYCTQQI